MAGTRTVGEWVPYPYNIRKQDVMSEQDWGPNPDHIHACRGCDEGVGCYEGRCEFDGYCDPCSADIEAEYEDAKKWMTGKSAP